MDRTDCMKQQKRKVNVFSLRSSKSEFTFITTALKQGLRYIVKFIRIYSYWSKFLFIFHDFAMVCPNIKITFYFSKTIFSDLRKYRANSIFVSPRFISVFKRIKLTLYLFQRCSYSSKEVVILYQA